MYSLSYRSELLLGVCYKYANKRYDMLFNVNRILTADVRTSGIILLTTLSVAILIFLGLYLFLATTPDKSTVFTNTANVITIFSSLAMSLITVRRLGFKSSEGKYYLYLVAGLALWACANSIWAYFELGLGIETPYPSIADFFWLLSYIPVSYHFYHSFRVWKQARMIRLRSLFISVISTSVLIGFLIYFSFQGSDEGGGLNLITIIVSNLYLVGDGVLLVPAIVILWSLRRVDILLLHRILISLFIVINAFGDVGYVYHEMLVDETTFAQQEWIWWLVYPIAYIVLTTGLLWYNRISVKIKNNVQDALDKRYPYLEKLWNETTDNNKSNNMSDSNMSENEEGAVEHLTNPELINHKIENTLKKTNEDILILISTEGIYLKIKMEIYKLIKMLVELNVDVRILIPGSDKLRDLAIELEKHSKFNFQRLYRPLSNDSVIFVIDSNAILDLEFKKEEEISNSEKKLLIYSEKESQVQSNIVVFENCWMLPLLHEKMPNQ